MEEHPAWAATKLLLEQPPDFVKSIVVRSTDLFSDPIGPGWALEAAITAPAGSPYAAHNPVYRISIDLPPLFPAEAPSLRWITAVRHPQVSEGGRFSATHLGWCASKSLWDALRVMHAMLGDLLPALPSAYRHLEHMWEEHDPTCQCNMLKILPFDYGVYAALPEAERLPVINEIYKVLFGSEFVSSAEEMELLNGAAAKWRTMTTFPELYAGPWQADWLAPSFVEAVRAGGAALESILREEVNGVYSFALFTPAFCARLLHELRAYEDSDLPRRRPNSMNNYGLILNEIGLQPAVDDLMRRYLQPLIRRVFAAASDGEPVDHHHTFMVQYMLAQDRSLDMHSDDAEVTVNVNICDAFHGSGLLFCGVYGDADHRRTGAEYQHALGRAVIHLGLHRHGAEQLSSGERFNVVIWCRSSAFRAGPGFTGRRGPPHPQELTPDLRCLSRTHDGDYGTWADIQRE